MNWKPIVKVVGIAGLLCSTSIAQAAQVYSNNFNSNAAGFVGGTIETAPFGQKFLSFKATGGSATLTIAGLTPGSTVSLGFDVYAIGSVDGNGQTNAPGVAGGGNGDYFTVTAGSSTIFNEAFSNYGNGETQSYPTNGSLPGTGAAAKNSLGYSGFPAMAGLQDTTYSFSLAGFTVTSPIVTFTFTDNSNQAMTDEFYGLDNVVVNASGTMSPVPLPSSAPMLGAAVLALGLAGFAAKRIRPAAKA